MAQVDYFLKLEGIAGESADDKHKGEIDVLSFSWGVRQKGSHDAGGGGGAGKAEFQDLHFMMRASKASPKLMLACATGEHLKKGALVARKAGKEQQEYLIVKFTDCMVTRYTVSGDGSNVVPLDDVTINFAVIEQEYKEQKADGSLGSPIKVGYDVKSNKAV